MSITRKTSWSNNFFKLLLKSVNSFVSLSELHPIENKPGLCFKIHTPDQPNFYPNPRRKEYPDLYESCTDWLKEDRNCLGLTTQNNEVIVLSCKGVAKRNRPGCYKVINRNKREEIVCQKLNTKHGCEVLTTRTNLNVVIYCYNRALNNSFVVKKRKQKRGS